jgi:hypothetical protein
VKRRRWSILIVPHGTDAPRRYDVGERSVRVFTGMLVACAMVVIAALMLLFSPLATPAARLASLQNARLQSQLAALDGAVAQLSDSLATLAEHEVHFRQLSGLPAPERTVGDGDSVRGAAPRGINRANVSMVRPFAAFLGDPVARPTTDMLMRQMADLRSAYAEMTDSINARLERARNTPSIMPTQGWLSGRFSKARMHPILHELRPHDGIDLSAPMGTPIVAPAGGTVDRVAVENGYGNIIEIDHGNGIRTRYAHCSRIVARLGQHVERGDRIATVGNTGLSVGPHLHYEILINGRPVNPLTYVLPSVMPSERASAF